MNTRPEEIRDSDPLRGVGGKLGSGVLSRIIRCCRTETEARTPTFGVLI